MNKFCLHSYVEQTLNGGCTEGYVICIFKFVAKTCGYTHRALCMKHLYLMKRARTLVASNRSAWVSGCLKERLIIIFSHTSHVLRHFEYLVWSFVRNIPSSSSSYHVFILEGWFQIYLHLSLSSHHGRLTRWSEWRALHLNFNWNGNYIFLTCHNGSQNNLSIFSCEVASSSYSSLCGSIVFESVLSFSFSHIFSLCLSLKHLVQCRIYLLLTLAFHSLLKCFYLRWLPWKPAVINNRLKTLYLHFLMKDAS